jgi:hypothetical protein
MRKVLQSVEKKEINRHYFEYKRTLSQCHEKMIESSRANRTYCTFGVPLQNELYPDWNFVHAITFICDSLREEGFKVQIHKPNLILINWTGFKIAAADKTEEENKKYLEEIKETEEIKKTLGIPE